MTEIENLYNKIYNGAERISGRSFIKLFEDNRILIENTNISTSDEVYKIIRILISDYAIYLEENGNIKKSIPYLNKAIALYEKDKENYEINLFTIPYYETLIWKRAKSYYESNQYNLSKSDLGNLVKNFPDNDKYYNWFQGTLFDQVRKAGNVFWWIAIAASMGTTYFNNNE